MDGIEVVHFGREFCICFDRVFAPEEAHEIKRQLAKTEVRFWVLYVLD